MPSVGPSLVCGGEPRSYRPHLCLMMSARVPGEWRGGSEPAYCTQNGEAYDARMEIANWDGADFDDSKWAAGPSFAYSLTVHSLHTHRDRVASLKTCRLHGAAIQKSLTTRARPSPDLVVRLE